MYQKEEALVTVYRFTSMKKRELTRSYSRTESSRFAKISTLQWAILHEVIDSGAVWMRPHRDLLAGFESQRTARIRAITRLVARGILTRDPLSGGAIIELGITERELYDAALRARRRDAERGIRFHSPAGNVALALERSQRRRRFLRKPRPPQTSPGRRIAERGAVAAAITFLAKQKPAGDLDPQDIVYVCAPALTKAVVLMHLESLKEEGLYDRILSEARSASAEGNGPDRPSAA